MWLLWNYVFIIWEIIAFNETLPLELFQTLSSVCFGEGSEHSSFLSQVPESLKETLYLDGNVYHFLSSLSTLGWVGVGILFHLSLQTHEGKPDGYVKHNLVKWTYLLSRHNKDFLWGNICVSLHLSKLILWFLTFIHVWEGQGNTDLSKCLVLLIKANPLHSWVMSSSLSPEQ